MSDWIEVSVKVDGEGAEAVADALRRYVHQGVAIEQLVPGEAWDDEDLPSGPLMVRAYFPADERAPTTRRQIEEALYYLSRLYPRIPAPAFRTVKEEDWAEAWKQHYHPIRVGKRLLIKPAWVDVESQPDDIVIEMDPGMAFGTGTHPTTQLCLMACEWLARQGMTAIDLGTGSGILAIAAARLGCYRVLARDIDEVAVRVARENVRRNGVEKQVVVQQGSLEGLLTTSRHFDLGMANLTAKIIIRLAGEGLGHLIWPGGKFVFSGLIEEQEPEVTAALEAIDLEVIDRRQMGEWVMLITQRRS
ncbi:MAG TPA: 50S ribosomal protein L11 methyltransferase [Chloroflexi bacterium]|nr:50S ribosomal protein L11 methyltransferase [Chloroflexota bacterium]